MKKEYSPEELLHKAAAYCSASEHCISEVKNKLESWGASESEQQRIIEYLEKNNFLNEERYAEAFVKDKFRFNKWGKVKIYMALTAKDVGKKAADAALSAIDETEYEEMLTAILKSKAKSIKYKSEYERKGKLTLFAQSRGFEYNVIEKVLKNFSN